jgi:hypothetical protein
MTHRELLLYWSTIGFEILLCVLVYARNLPRRLPFFTSYVTVIAASTFGIQLVYRQFGFRSVASYNAAWIVTGVHIVVRGLAVAELCRHELRGYRGIWALTWRALAILAVFFLGHAAIDAWGQAGGIAIYGLTLERDIAISSIAIILALLLIRNYYGLALEPLFTWIAIGILIVSIVDTMNDTTLKSRFTGPLLYWFFSRYSSSWAGLKSQVESANALWSTIRTSGFVVSMSIWCYALRKPLPAPAKGPVLLPAEVYRELSPALNLRLRAFNDRLLEMLKS